ncbi:hypothetical protein [Halobacillus litoralis]|uniref:hypothetical protein n=1 Tax=Halobacillus litoralis TaxID=45668 RepID=UPI00136F6EA2|nr:hypothetical protein [Halobacillus litoralis]MYL38538.1 hypothetical protein [Halobacillus litoralis]
MANCRKVSVPGKLPMKFPKKKEKHEKKHDCLTGCKCHFKKPEFKPAKLNSDCFVENALVGTKQVQKVAESTLPLSLFAAAGVTIGSLVSVEVVPNLENITMNARIIKNKVVNIGLVPATITVNFLDGTGALQVGLLNTAIPFQAHTDFPGACPEDNLTETPLEVEGIFTQEGVPVVDVAGITLVEGIIVKIILKTTITVTRPVIRDAHGNVCDLNPDRCKQDTDAPSFTFPGPDNEGIL